MSGILVRADASPAIGTGHIMRCLTLAKALADRQVVFACAQLTDALAERIQTAGHRLVRLAGDTGGPADLAATLDLARTSEALVVDGYLFSTDYRHALRQAGHPILAIDDLADRDLAADLVVNTSPAASPAAYVGQSQPVEYLLGPAHALVHQDFLAWRQAPVPDDAPLLISFGGSDPLGLTLPVLERLRALIPNTPLLAVVGGSVPRAVTVVREVQRLGARALHNVRDMAPVLRACRLAVSAAGTTLFELATLGRPALLVIVADNQRTSALTTQTQGWASALDGTCTNAAQAVAEQAAALWHAPDRLLLLGQTAEAQVDGQGAGRIAARLSARLG